MKLKFKILAIAALLTFSAYGSFATAQYAPYRNGYNGNGSFYGRGSSNYRSSVYVNGYSYDRAYVPDYPGYGYIPSQPRYNYNNYGGYAPRRIYPWQDFAR